MNKFVLITNKDTKENVARIRMRDIDYHTMLLYNNDKCYGGGLYFRNDTNKTIQFYGSSCDLGKPLFEKFKQFELTDEFKEYKILWLGTDLSLPGNVKPVDLTSSIIWGFYL